MLSKVLVERALKKQLEDAQYFLSGAVSEISKAYYKDRVEGIKLKLKKVQDNAKETS